MHPMMINFTATVATSIAYLKPRKLAYTNYSWATLLQTVACYAGVKLGSNGILYCRMGRDTWVIARDLDLDPPEWLVNGANTNFWCRRTIQGSGTLTTDAGSGWLALTSDRIFDIQILETFVTKNCRILIEIATDAAGTSVVASAQYDLSVRNEPGGTPTGSDGTDLDGSEDDVGIWDRGAPPAVPGDWENA